MRPNPLAGETSLSSKESDEKSGDLADITPEVLENIHAFLKRKSSFIVREAKMVNGDAQMKEQLNVPVRLEGSILSLPVGGVLCSIDLTKVSVDLSHVGLEIKSNSASSFVGILIH